MKGGARSGDYHVMLKLITGGRHIVQIVVTLNTALYRSFEHTFLIRIDLICG